VYLIDSPLSPDLQTLNLVFEQLTVIQASELASVAPQQIILADIDLFLTQRWSQPTIVLAHAHQGVELATAWQRGAVAGWIRGHLPQQPDEVVQQLQSQYLRHQDCRDLPRAARLQQQLLPPLPQLTNYQLERFFQPAAFLSGDWIDFWQIDPQHFLFYLADVSGHGVTSSLLSSWMAAFHGSATSPQALLSRMNQLLVEQNTGKHITLLCGLLDLDTHEVHWCSAGHYPPAIYLQPNQPPQILSTSSFPLGLTPQLNIRMQTLHLAPQSRLIFASDGALELFTGGLSQQLAQLVEQLVHHQFQPTDHLPDDLTLLSLSRLG
jgi:serine phosphatase RsbU (regulator of sigma subunit)